jgi:uncharacterized protein (TIRG00374 family)
MSSPFKTGVRFAASVVVGIGILAAVLYYVGWRRTLGEMANLGVEGILTVLANVTLMISLWVVSWGILLRSYGVVIPVRRVIGARLSGHAVTYMTPTLYFGGEPVRALMVAGASHAPTTRIFATIIVERFLSGVGMILFIMGGVIFALLSPDIPAPEKRLYLAAIAFIAFWILIGFVNFAGNLKWISKIIRSLRRLFPRWRRGLEKAAAKVSETEDEVYYAFTRHWRAALLVFFLQMLATATIYIRPQVFFYFASGMTFSFPQLSLLFMLNTVLSLFLWITPGGLGTSEAGLIGIFHVVASRVSSEGVVAYSLVFKFAEAIFIGIGIYYLLSRGVGRIRSQRERMKETAASSPQPAEGDAARQG